MAFQKPIKSFDGLNWDRLSEIVNNEAVQFTVKAGLEYLWYKKDDLWKIKLDVHDYLRRHPAVKILEEGVNAFATMLLILMGLGGVALLIEILKSD